MRANRRRYVSLVAVSMLSITAACTSSDPFEAGADRPIAFDQTTTSTSSDPSEDVAAPLDPASESDSTPTPAPAPTPTPTSNDQSLLEGSGELDASGNSPGNQPATETDTTPSATAADIGSDDAAVSDSCGPEQNSADGTSQEPSIVPCILVNESIPATK